MPKPILLNIWILSTSIPGLRDVLIVGSIPLDICLSAFMVLFLLIFYGLIRPNKLGYILLFSSLFVLYNEGIYQWVLSLIILLPVLWAPILVHRIRLSTKILLAILLFITLINILYYGSPEITNWRIPAKLLLITLIIHSRGFQIILALVSGFKSLLFIPLRKFSVFMSIFYILGIVYFNILNARIFWNLNRFKYINLFGTGFMHSSSKMNLAYRSESLSNDRFNRVISVLDFGLLDMVIKLGLILAIIYIFYYFKIFTKYAGIHFATALFLINITHGYLIHENLIWETFFLIEYFRRFGYQSKQNLSLTGLRLYGLKY